MVRGPDSSSVTSSRQIIAALQIPLDRRLNNVFSSMLVQSGTTWLQRWLERM